LRTQFLFSEPCEVRKGVTADSGLDDATESVYASGATADRDVAAIRGVPPEVFGHRRPLDGPQYPCHPTRRKRW
jgi:hypothetical protein